MSFINPSLGVLVRYKRKCILQIKWPIPHHLQGTHITLAQDKVQFEKKKGKQFWTGTDGQSLALDNAPLQSAKMSTQQKQQEARQQPQTEDYVVRLVSTPS